MKKKKEKEKKPGQFAAIAGTSLHHKNRDLSLHISMQRLPERHSASQYWKGVLPSCAGRKPGPSTCTLSTRRPVKTSVFVTLGIGHYCIYLESSLGEQDYQSPEQPPRRTAPLAWSSSREGRPTPPGSATRGYLPSSDSPESANISTALIRFLA